jgi:hypothetical protein
MSMIGPSSAQPLTIGGRDAVEEFPMHNCQEGFSEAVDGFKEACFHGATSSSGLSVAEKAMGVKSGASKLGLTFVKGDKVCYISAHPPTFLESLSLESRETNSMRRCCTLGTRAAPCRWPTDEAGTRV